MGAFSPVEAAQNIGKYTLIEKIGEGYLGPVYRGFDQDLGNPVVVRILCEGIRWDAKLEETFSRECRVLAELRHANIATIFDVGREGESRYIVMESLGSGTLGNLIAQNSAVPVETKLSIMIQVAEGLSHAHAKGILHRDLGPGKIHLAPDGNVKIRDFGLAHILMRHLPHPVVRFGAPIYLCPEQIQQKKCNERADIFSAGTIFYELITHSHPFHDPDSNKALDNILSDTQIPTFEKFPEAPPGVWSILKSCLARDTEDRFQSAEELANACRELLKSLREDTQLMMGELYASLSPLKKAAQQPNASAGTKTLLEEINRLLHGANAPDYTSLDRLMTMLMDQYPAIQAVSSALPELDSVCPQLPPETAPCALTRFDSPLPPTEIHFHVGEQPTPVPPGATEKAPAPPSAEDPELAPEPVRASGTAALAQPIDAEKVPAPFPKIAETVTTPQATVGSPADTVPPDKGSSVTGAVHEHRSPPVPLYRRMRRPSYRSTVVLLAILIIAAAAYIALGTEATAPIRKIWNSIYTPSRDTILGVFDSSRKQAPNEPSSASAVKEGSQKGNQESAGNPVQEARAVPPEEKSEAGKMVEESVSRISALINSGKLQPASLEIDRLQQNHPNAPEISWLRRKLQSAGSKQVQEQSRKNEEQQKLLLKQNEEEWNRQCLEFLAHGKYGEAAGALTLWLSQNPASTRAQELNARVQEIQRQLKTYTSAMAENRYADALNAAGGAEKLNPADPNLAEMRRQVESRKAAARATLTVHRLGAKGAILLDGRPIGKDGEVEGESIPIGNHMLSIESGGISIASRAQEYSEGQRVTLVYDLLKQSLRTMTDPDRDLLARRKSMEEPERFQLEHDHGVFRGSCRGVLSLDSLDVAYSPSSGSHGFRIPFKLLKLRIQGKSASLFYISDNTHFQTFKFQDEPSADKFKQKWDELKALLR